MDSIDVAVLGIPLGRISGLPRSQLRDLALGCPRHDVGTVHIDDNGSLK